MTTFEKEVRKLKENSVYGDHVHNFFTISNKDPTNGKVEELKKLIKNCALKRGHHIPTRWFRLLQSLKEKVNGKTTNWLSLKNAKAKAIKDVHIDVTEIEAALLYFHGVGEVVYFSEIPDMIVIEPTWLFQELTKIITIPSHHEHIICADRRKHLRNLKEDTLLHEDVLKAVWPTGMVEPLVNIMMKYALLLPVPRDYTLRQSSTTIPPGKVYLVPSLLPAKKPDEAHQAADTHEGAAPPVILRFSDDFIPVGHTSRLITALCNEHDWRVTGELCKDAATFSVRKDDNLLILTLAQMSDKIVVSCDESEKSNPICQESLKTIYDALRKLSLQRKIKVWISCHCSGLRETKLPDGNLEQKYPCIKGKVHKFDSSPYRIWFKTHIKSRDVS